MDRLWNNILLHPVEFYKIGLIMVWYPWSPWFKNPGTFPKKER